MLILYIIIKSQEITITRRERCMSFCIGIKGLILTNLWIPFSTFKVSITIFPPFGFLTWTFFIPWLLSAIWINSKIFHFGNPFSFSRPKPSKITFLLLKGINFRAQFLLDFSGVSLPKVSGGLELGFSFWALTWVWFRLGFHPFFTLN